MKKDQAEKAVFYFELDSIAADCQTVYFLAGKTIMSVLLSEELESVEILEIDEKIIRQQKSAESFFASKKINNAADFPDFSIFQPSEMRRKIEKSFLIVAAGIWAKSIFLFNGKNKSKSLNFDRIQKLAVKSNINLLFALRSVLSEIQLKNLNLNSTIVESSFLDYEAFLYRQSFAIISQDNVWQAIVEISEQLKNNRILNEREIYQICAKQKNLTDLRKEVTLFYSAD